MDIIPLFNIAASTTKPIGKTIGFATHVLGSFTIMNLNLLAQHESLSQVHNLHGDVTAYYHS